MNPIEQIAFAGEIGHVATLKDGRILSCYTERDSLANLDGVSGSNLPLVVDDGSIHVFSLRFYSLGRDKEETWHSVLLHTVSNDGGMKWSPLKEIDFGHGYTGALNSALQMDNGRILVPLSYLDEQRTSGKFVSMVVYSDDGGQTWGRSNVMHNDWTAHPWHMPEAYHQTNWTVNQALEFLRKRDPACPFFLVVPFIAPHPPLVPPAPYMERYLRMDLPEPVTGDWATPPENEGLGLGQSSSRVQLTGEALRSARAGYYGLINHVDDQINRLLNPVNGIDRMTDHNTVVIFTSDHGEMLGDHYLWRKTVPYEPSARIPFLLRAPERFGLTPGTVIDQPVCLEDIMPTVLAMAEVEIPGTVEGQNLLPLLRGEATTWRSHLHIEHAPMHHTLTDGREKFIWFVQDGREQFFDLLEDPTECHDLIHDPGKTDRIAHWRRRTIEELKDRPEGFTDGKELIPGRLYTAVLGSKR